jgi:hypothetical protein
LDFWKKQIQDGFNIQGRLKSVDAQLKETGKSYRFEE